MKPALPITALVPLCISATMYLHHRGITGYGRWYKAAFQSGWPALAGLWNYFACEWPAAAASGLNDVTSGLEWRAAA